MKKESFKTWRFRLFMNLYPMYLGTGGKIVFISSDWREVKIRLRRSLWTYNYVGTIFGGSMFSASDPFYMLMILHNLGREYVIWDKSAHIRFKKPGKSTLYAHFELSEEVLSDIKEKVTYSGETDYSFLIRWKDKNGVVHAEIERTVYIADKEYYKEKQASRKANI